VLAEKFPGGWRQQKKGPKNSKIALLSLFQGGGEAMEKKTEK